MARTHEGSGIGLALVRDLVGLHGGTIEVASKPGEGTTFTVAIPYGTAHLPAERIGAARSLSSTSAGAAYVEEALRWTSPSPSQGETPAADSGQRTARILVADDNTDMRDYVARILRRHWTVECVSDGVEALEAVRRSSPDLLLSDVMMPRLDGFALVRELRGDAGTATLPIILLSARAGEEATAVGLRTGADDYLVKPFSASALVVRVEAQLAAARLRETVRRNAEAERERLEIMFRETPAGICLLRGDDFVLEVANPVMLELWGRNASIVGRPLLAALPELASQWFGRLLRAVRQTGVSQRGKDALARLDRSRNGVFDDVYLDFVFVPLLTAEGAVDGIFVHAYDVTDKVSAVRHAEQLRVDAERAVRAREELLAIVSHDLRNPLSTVLMGAAHIDRMAGDGDAGQRTKKAAGSIVRAAENMARLIGDLLDLAKLEAGQPLPLERATHDLVDLARQAADLLEPLARARQLTLTTELGAPFYVFCDSDRVQQVLANLIGNAIKFTREGGTIEVGARTTAGEIAISVRDSGTGIPEHQVPHIFEPYWQADAQRKGGAGLGLSIVKAIVEAHGGRIGVDTSLGRGSTFWFTMSGAEAGAEAMEKS